ncbi:hypothetical protein H4R22_001712, partial [Coemansia sp. RSA 1290]
MVDNKTCTSTVKSTGKKCTKSSLKDYSTCYSHLTKDDKQKYKSSKSIKSNNELKKENEKLKLEVEILRGVLQSLSIK